MSDATPFLKFNSQPVVDLGYAGSGFVPIQIDATRAKPIADDAPTRGISMPPLLVVLSIVYVLGLIGTGLYFLLYFLFSA